MLRRTFTKLALLATTLPILPALKSPKRRELELCPAKQNEPESIKGEILAWVSVDVGRPAVIPFPAYIHCAHVSGGTLRIGDDYELKTYRGHYAIENFVVPRPRVEAGDVISVSDCGGFSAAGVTLIRI